MKTYKEEIADLLAPHTGLSPQEIHAVITLPQHEGHGDFSFPCFTLAKKMRKAPAAIAQDLAATLKPTETLVKIEALNGYLNFFVDKTGFAKRTLSAIAAEKTAYGSSQSGQGKTVVIDYSSPNMGKEL